MANRKNANVQVELGGGGALLPHFVDMGGWHSLAVNELLSTALVFFHSFFLSLAGGVKHGCPANISHHPISPWRSWAHTTHGEQRQHSILTP